MTVALESINIHGYRGFKNKCCITIAVPSSNKAGSGLTIITGPNNSGKSTILECLRARNGYGTPSFSVGVRNASVEEVEITYTFDGQKESIKSLRKGASETAKLGAISNSKIFVLPSRRTFSPYFGKNSHSRDQHIQQAGLPPQRSSVLSGFEARLFNILSDEQTQAAFNQILAEVLGYSPEWSIDQSEQGQYFLKFFSASHAHSSDGMGEGIVSVFAIVDALYDSNPDDIVVIDEPELSLHPALQKRLARLLMRLSSDRQIVVSTHSPYFVDLRGLQNGAKLIRVISGNDGIEVHQLGAASLGAISALSSGNLYNPHVFGLDARELFFQEDGIVLTEGQEDVLLLPIIADQLGESIPGTFFGWGVGGAGNIKHLCRILKELGFKKVTAILDGDKIQEAGELKGLFPEYHICTIPADDIRTKKPRKETAGVDGVLDEKLQVRDQHIDAMKAILSAVREYMTGSHFPLRAVDDAASEVPNNPLEV